MPPSSHRDYNAVCAKVDIEATGEGPRKVGDVVARRNTTPRDGVAGARVALIQLHRHDREAIDARPVNDRRVRIAPRVGEASSSIREAARIRSRLKV